MRRTRRIQEQDRTSGVAYTQETNETVAKLLALENRIAEANKGIKELASSARNMTGGDTASGSLIERAADPGRSAGSDIDLQGVLGLLVERLGKPGFDDNTIKRLGKLFISEFSPDHTQEAARKRTSSS